MRKIMTIALLCAAASLSGCLSINNNKPNIGPETYDFGYAGTDTPDFRLAPGILLDSMTANESLNNIRIRYRLAYENAEQVHTYSNSRWAAPPRELMAQKTRLVPPSPVATNCTLRLNLELFDHIFDSTTQSHALVTLNATLTDKTRHILASHRISAESKAASADARGGVAALNRASSQALADALAWASALPQAATCTQE